MNNGTKYLFETSFDPAKAEIDAPPPPTFSEQELAAARDEGFREGHAEGHAEMSRAIEQAAADALAAISAQLVAMNGRFAEIRDAAIASGVDVVAATVRKMVPALAKRNGLAEIEHLVRDSLHELYDEPRVVIRAHDSVIEALHDRIDGMAAASGFMGKVVLFGDEQLTETDCRVEWADGGAERNLGELWRRIDAAIERVTDGNAAAAQSPTLGATTIGAATLG
jgi:flagellar assembly protein FliH